VAPMRGLRLWLGGGTGNRRGVPQGRGREVTRVGKSDMMMMRGGGGGGALFYIAHSNPF